MRWLYHALTRDEWEGAWGHAVLTPASLGREGFVHASYRDVVVESARLYLPKESALVVLQLDPRLLGVAIDVAETPRGPMPHIRGAITVDAIALVWELAELEAAIASGLAPDVIT